MNSKSNRRPSRPELLAELERLRAQLAETKDRLHAIPAEEQARDKGQTPVQKRMEAESRGTYLASFPRRNPNPVLEMDLNGEIRYMNPAAMRLFPDLGAQGLRHPWLKGWAAVRTQFRKGQADTAVRDLTVGDRTYQQAFYCSAENRFVRIYGFDITDRKRAEQALQQAHERLQTQAEELRAANEELQAQQEELQSQAQELRETEQALRRLNEELERRVAARTAELSHTNEALRQAGAYHRSLLEASLDPLVTIGPDGKITDVNAATEAVTGCTRKKLIGTDFSNYFTDPAQARAGYRQVFQEGFVRDYPLEIRHTTGRVTPVLYNATVYRDAAGAIAGVFAAARDVTQLRRAEQTVQAERQRLRDVLETLPAYLVLLTPDYHVSFANRFFRERFGESHGQRCFEHLFGRTEPCATCETYTVLKTGKPHHREWTGPDGRNYDVHDFPFTDVDGSPLIMEMGIDITARKRAEEALKKVNETLEQRVAERTQALRQANEQLQKQTEELCAQEQALRDRENELQLVMDTVPALMAYIDSQFRYRWVNQGYERWFGLPAREVEGRHVRDVLGPAAWQIIRPHLERTLAGEVVTYEERMPYRLGESHWVYVTCAPDRDQAGHVQGFIAHVTDIGQRRQAEEAVRRSGQRFRLLSETAGRLLAAENPQDVINDLCRQVMEHLDCQAFFNFLVDEKAGRLRLNACAGISQKEARRIEWLDLGRPICGCVARDGRRIVAEEIPTTRDPRIDFVASCGLRAHACHPLTAEGKVLGTLSFGTRTRTHFSEDDLSLMKTVADQVAVALERMRAKHALAESEQRLRLALAGGGMGRWEWDLQSDSWSCCARSNELLGLETTGETTAEVFFRSIYPQDREALEKHLTSARAEAGDFRAEFRVVHNRAEARGEILWLAAHSKVIRDAQGRGVRMIGVLYDITPRKQMEEQLRGLNDRLEEEVQAQTEELRDAVDRLQDEVVRRVLAEGKLRKRSQMLEAFFQHTITPLAFLDKYFNFVRVNAAYARAAGRDPEYFAGQNYFALYPQAENRALFEQVVRTKLPHYAHAEPLDYLAPQKQGATYWNWRLTPLLDDQGQVQFLVLNLEDVTDRQRAFQELEQRARQLQKLTLELSEAEDRERKRLAEILHDDLQQQLAAAKFHLGLLSSRVRNEPALHEIAGQLNQMMKDAIEKSRSLSHELSPAVLYQSDLGETFEWLARQVQTKHGLTVHVEVRGRVDSPSEALKAFLYKAAQELLFNVVKHARTKEIRLRLQRTRGQLWLTIGDRGQGFDPQTLGRTSGFGLLSIRERVGLLGGRMKIRSAEGRGSTFLIAVPDAAVPAAPILPESSDEQTGAAGAGRKKSVKRAGGRSLRVLLVDDHEVMREGLAALLSEQQDIEIVGQAGTGREAVDLAYELRPDVIIMDAAMPVMAGDEATRQIKRHLPDIRVVALSMFDEAQMADRMRRAGAEIYLLKTGPSEELLAAIRGVPKQ
jgi:PAS domain S-box-containing protein